MSPFTCTMPSPIGRLRLVASNVGLRSILWPDQDPIGPSRRNAILDQAESELADYFSGRRRTFGVALEMEGTEFEKTVWSGQLGIPYGKTRYYAQLASAIGRPQAARAVGRANSRNPLGIIVPCHRVIGKNRALVGYAGGLAVKEFLLRLEGADYIEP